MKSCDAALWVVAPAQTPLRRLQVLLLLLAMSTMDGRVSRIERRCPRRRRATAVVQGDGGGGDGGDTARAMATIKTTLCDHRGPPRR